MLVNAFIQYYVLVLCKKAAILILTNVSLFPILHELMSGTWPNRFLCVAYMKIVQVAHCVVLYPLLAVHCCCMDG